MSPPAHTYYYIPPQSGVPQPTTGHNGAFYFAPIDSARRNPASTDGAQAATSRLENGIKFQSLPTPFPPMPSSFPNIPPPPIVFDGVQPHICSVCYKPRSKQYQIQRAIKPEEQVPQSTICRRCRVQDVTSNEPRSNIASVASSNNTTKADKNQKRKMVNLDHQRTTTGVKGDANMTEDARSPSPPSNEAGEVIRGIKVVRIPASRNNRIGKNGLRDESKSQRRDSISDGNEPTSAKRATSFETRMQSRGRAIERQSRPPKRTDSDKPDQEPKQTYDGAMEDVETARWVAEEARHRLRQCRRLSQDAQTLAADRAASARRDTTDPSIPECRYSYISPPLGLSEPSHRLRSKRHERLHHDSHREEQVDESDSETNSPPPSRPRPFENTRYARPVPPSTSAASNPPSHIRTAPNHRSDHHAYYADDYDEFSRRASNTTSSHSTYSATAPLRPQQTRRLSSPPPLPRGRTREVRLRGILRTPSQSRHRTISRESSAAGPRVKFALRSYSPSDEEAAVEVERQSENKGEGWRRRAAMRDYSSRPERGAGSKWRRNTISDVKPAEERARGRWRKREERGGSEAWMERLRGLGAGDGFSDSEKTMHPNGFRPRRRRNDGDHERERTRFEEWKERRRESSSSGDEMEKWRSRARQRSLKRGERLRADRRVEVRKARPGDAVRYEFARVDDDDDDDDYARQGKRD